MIVLVALGGALGAVVRFGLQSGLMLVVPSYPLGTAVANMVGSFAAGLVYALLPPTAVQYKALIMTGFLGGLTTLSAFSLEVVLQLQDGKFFQALAHWLICACVCLVLCYLGIRLGLRLLP